MSLLEHPKAQALLADAEITPAASWARRLEEYLERYLPVFYRQEQRELARVVIRGKLSNLQRKTSEPIAYQAGLQRKPVQHFVGAGRWDDEAVMAELRRHGVEEMLQAAKGEVGLAHYEVHSWLGWHNHMTLSLLALWFWKLERGRLRKRPS
jgi:SRSO17 transposase